MGLAAARGGAPFRRNRFRIGANVGYRLHGGKNPRFDNDTTGAPQLAEGTLRYGNLGTFGLALSLRALDALDIVAETYGTYLTDGRLQLEAEDVAGGRRRHQALHREEQLLDDGRRQPRLGRPASKRPTRVLCSASSTSRPSATATATVTRTTKTQCPDEPEDFDGFQDGDGCPEPDNDNDGILDVDDRCPNVPEDRDGDQDDDGCPEGKADGDRDGDGIPDSQRQVPRHSGGYATASKTTTAAPKPTTTRTASPTRTTSARTTLKTTTSSRTKTVAPIRTTITIKSPTSKDKCPNDPETYNGYQDEDGCPDKGKVIIEGNDIIIFEKVQFETNSAKILPASNEILNAVAAVLKGHPEFKVIEVGGHADERGSDEHNLRLTKARAASVMDALKGRGINQSRLLSQGYGEYCPLDDRSQPAAWDKNRRVEFKVVRTEEGDTGVKRGCDTARGKGIYPPGAPK
ncbi:MAG: OmpA family protein [Polyangiaceae bacterium]